MVRKQIKFLEVQIPSSLCSFLSSHVKSMINKSLTRLRVVSNIGDGDSGVGEIQARVKFSGALLLVARLLTDTGIYFARMAKIRHYS